MRPAKLLAVLFVAVIVPAGVVTAIGLRWMSADTARGEARYREQAAALASDIDEALRAVVREVEAGDANSIVFRADAQGSLTEPAVDSVASPRSTDTHSLIAVLRSEIDQLERNDQLHRARERLRGISAS